MGIIATALKMLLQAGVTGDELVRQIAEIEDAGIAQIPPLSPHTPLSPEYIYNNNYISRGDRDRGAGERERGERKQRAKRLPDDFDIDDDMMAWAQNEIRRSQDWVINETN